jgi:anti-anti-sigma factor
MMNIKASPQHPKPGDPLRIKAQSNLIASSVEGERERMLRVLESAQGPVILDLSSTHQIDSLGITLVLGLFKSCEKKGLRFSIEGVQTDIMRVFRLFSMTKLFPIAEG